MSRRSASQAAATFDSASAAYAKDVNDAIALLDLGCGVGMFHRHLSDFGALHGLDVSGASVAIARAANPSRSYAIYDGSSAPYADRAFDLIFTACVIHHVAPADRPAFLGEMRRMLRPGGLAVVFEHNPFNPLTRLGVARCAFDANAVLISSRALGRLLARAGFGNVTARSLFTLPPLAPALIRLDRHLAGLPFGAQYELVAEAGS
jgi:SAM-dependent methyltransferase